MLLVFGSKGVSGAETLAATANVFMGQTEAPLIIKPYVATMTRSELLALMIGLLMYAVDLRKDFYIRKESQPLFSNSINSSIDGVAAKLKKFFNDLF